MTTFSKRDDFTNQLARVATDKDLRGLWLGGKPGEYFRCFMCGYKFQLGDYWRWVYTNDIKGASGNPIVCEKCDGPDVRDRWKQKCEEIYSPANWHFNRPCGCMGR